MLTPCRLRVEYKINPVGMDEKIPRFSYELTGNSKAQTAYQIVVRKDDGSVVWDSGKVADAHSLQIEYDGIPLYRFTRYSWQVKVWDENGKASAWSKEAAWFETGYLDSKWSAEWLSCAWGGNQNPISRFLRDFKITKKVASARLYATALGVYDVYINGRKLGDAQLKPGWTDYGRRVQYQAYDLTGELVRGDNTIGAQVADGWYVCKGYGKVPMFLAELHIRYQDGTQEVIPTNKDWRAFYIHINNPMRMASLFNGEIVEAWEETDWKMPGGFRTYYATNPSLQGPAIRNDKPLRIVWQHGADNRRKHRLDPVSITKRSNYTWLVDFGQNFTGHEFFRLHNTHQGSTIVIKHGEMLNPDGSLYVQNLRNAWQRTVYTTGTHKLEEYEPQYTYFGFRYLEISGWPAEKLAKDDIWAYAVYSDLEQSGDFSCSEPLINRLYQNIVWGQRSNFLDVPTDCPQRDERQGWTGDTQVFANIATYNMACGDFYTKWLEDLNLAQGVDGSYPFIAPITGFPARNDGASGWSDAAIVCPFVMMTKYADKRIVRKYFGNMVSWIDWLVNKSGGDYNINTALFGDWLNQDAEIDRTCLSVAYLASMCTKLALMADVIGEEQEAKNLRHRFADVKRVFIERYYTSGGVLREKTQTAAVLALAFDLCPDEKAKKKTIDYLVKDIRVTRKNHLSTGFLGTPLLLHTLTKIGYADLAYDLLFQTSYPSWLYPVTQGATTMWERWNSWTEEKGFGDPEMNSFNHYAYGAVGDWFFETICGIRPILDGAADALGMKKFELAPVPGKRLTHAEGSYHSGYGLIRSAWKRTKTKWLWDFTVPCNSTAIVTLPADMKAPAKLPDGLKRIGGQLIACPGDHHIELGL